MNHKRHHPTLTLLVSQLAPEDQPALGNFLEENRATGALGLIETALATHVAEEVRYEREQVMRHLAAFSPEKLMKMAEKIDRIEDIAGDTLRAQTGDRDALKEEVQSAVEESSMRVRASLKVGLMFVLLLNMLGVFGAWWFADESSADADDFEPTVTSSR